MSAWKSSLSVRTEQTHKIDGASHFSRAMDGSYDTTTAINDKSLSPSDKTRDTSKSQ